MWFCLGIRGAVGRASTSRMQSLRSAWTRVLAVSGSAALVEPRTMGLSAVVATGLLSWTPLLSLETVIEVPFELYQHHLIVTKGSIGPLNGLSLLIDTGTIPSIVDDRIARKLHVQAEPSMLVAFGQSVSIQSAMFDGFRIGARQPGPVPAGVSDLSYLEGVRIDAIVGLDVLARTSFSIDYRKRVLRFSADGREESVAPLELVWPFLTVQMTIGGQQVRLLVDTGSSDLVLFKSRMPAALSPIPWRGDKTVQYASGAARLLRLDLRQVRLGSRVWDRLPAWVLDQALDRIPAEHRWRARCAGPRLPASASSTSSETSSVAAGESALQDSGRRTTSRDAGIFRRARRWVAQGRELVDAATDLLVLCTRKNVPGKVIAQLMRHAKVHTTLNVYAQVLDGSLQKAAETAGSELFTLC